MDVGVKIPLRPLDWLGGRSSPLSITLRHPTYGTLLLMARYFHRMGLSIEALSDYTQEQWVALLATHGREIAGIVACAICRGYWANKLFHRPVRWFLLWRVHPAVLGDVMLLLIEQINTAPFWITIRLASTIDPSKARLSQA